MLICAFHVLMELQETLQTRWARTCYVTEVFSSIPLARPNGITGYRRSRQFAPQLTPVSDGEQSHVRYDPHF